MSTTASHESSPPQSSPALVWAKPSAQWIEDYTKNNSNYIVPNDKPPFPLMTDSPLKKGRKRQSSGDTEDEEKSREWVYYLSGYYTHHISESVVRTSTKPRKKANRKVEGSGDEDEHNEKPVPKMKGKKRKSKITTSESSHEEEPQEGSGSQEPTPAQPPRRKRYTAHLSAYTKANFNTGQGIDWGLLQHERILFEVLKTLRKGMLWVSKGTQMDVMVWKGTQMDVMYNTGNVDRKWSERNHSSIQRWKLFLFAISKGLGYHEVHTVWRS